MQDFSYLAAHMVCLPVRMFSYLYRIARVQHMQCSREVITCLMHDVIMHCWDRLYLKHMYANMGLLTA